MFNFIKRLLFSDHAVDDNDSNHVDESDHFRRKRQQDTKSFSYIFNKKTLCFDQFSFLLRYLFHEDEIWILASDFAEGIGLNNIDEAIGFIENDRYKKTVRDLLNFKRNPETSSMTMETKKKIFVINKHGAMQILDNVNFENKIEFTTWLIENVFDAMKEQHLSSKKKPLPIVSLPIEEKMTEMLRVFDAFVKNTETFTMDTLTKNNEAIETLKTQMCENFAKIEKKISAQELCGQLEKYRIESNRNSYRGGGVDGHNIETNSENYVVDDCRFHGDVDSQSDDAGCRQMCRYESVRFPRDSSKHPRLAVFVKPLDNNSTQIAFLSGQTRRHRAMKRKYNDMELVYDSVHPNPQLAMLCLNEELDMKNFNYKKKTRRTFQVESSVETVKSFITENL
uniref:38.7K protein n=1 Tax=Chrysodeixis includens nucleopolyhedrovirus TaxID=1207438 RepID=A0A1C8ZZ96_9ABAC|nr:38.7K protein [Chrysodeixis includens nucleopolyhedrovirus]